MARPTKLDATVTRAICANIRKGAPKAHAAVSAGISETRFYDWMSRGRKAAPGDEEYVVFFEAVEKANADIIVKMAGVVTNDAIKNGNSRAALLFLERRDRAHFGASLDIGKVGTDKLLDALGQLVGDDTEIESES